METNEPIQIEECPEGESQRLRSRAVEAARVSMLRRGYDVLDVDQEKGSIVAFDDECGSLVFADVTVRRGSFADMPETKRYRSRREADAVDYLIAHDEVADGTPVRFDRIDIDVIRDDRALLRHHINCLAADSGDALCGDAA